MFESLASVCFLRGRSVGNACFWDGSLYLTAGHGLANVCLIPFPQLISSFKMISIIALPLVMPSVVLVSLVLCKRLYNMGN